GSWFHYTLSGEETPLRMKALMSRLEDGVEGAAPGTLLDENLLVQCGDGGAVRLLKAQKPGSKAMEAADLLRGLSIPAGAIFA
ncbi:MAG: methionyl-tRNA formyltransferase, partial [Pseudomonadota bacterium]